MDTAYAGLENPQELVKLYSENYNHCSKIIGWYQLSRGTLDD